MKVTLALVLVSAMLVGVFGYPHPEADFDAGRYRRQAQFQPGNNFGPAPRIDIPKPPRQTFPQGTVGGNIDYGRGRGLTGTVNGQATVWQSRNGMTDLGAQGHYTRTFSGPARGAQDYGAGLTFRHRF